MFKSYAHGDNILISYIEIADGSPGGLYIFLS